MKILLCVAVAQLPELSELQVFGRCQTKCTSDFPREWNYWIWLSKRCHENSPLHYVAQLSELSELQVFDYHNCSARSWRSRVFGVHLYHLKLALQVSCEDLMKRTWLTFKWNAKSTRYAFCQVFSLLQMQKDLFRQRITKKKKICKELASLAWKKP